MSDPPPERRVCLDPRAAAWLLDAVERANATAHGDGHDLPVIAGYQLVRRISGGGAGDVYEARRPGSDRPLALKLLRQRMGESPAVRRAWRELDILDTLRHSAVPRLLDHGLHEGRLYLVTEYVDGPPLDQHCAAHGLDRRQRVELLAHVCDVVQALHEQGILHRDVKPSNVLVDRQGRPMLIDLGAAAALGGNALETLTRDGCLPGSPAFMSPEQAQGRSDAVSTRTDVYGLGATAYAVLLERPPHDVDGPIHEVIRRVACERAGSPRAIDPSFPRPLAAVLEKAVATSPSGRYASAAELASDLRRWLGGEPVEAGPAPLFHRLIRVAARHPVISTAVTCLLVSAMILGATAAVVWWLNGRPAYITLADRRTRARLHASSGLFLREWRTEKPDGIHVAELVDRPGELGGGRVIVVGIDHERFDPSSELSLYDADWPWEPFWTSGTGPPGVEMPPPISRVEGDTYGLSFARLVDIFPESPGPEILAVHGHVEYSPNVVRVYALDGTVLYQVWHDGAVGHVVWLPDAGTLVLGGLNSENNWAGRGYEEIISGWYQYPWVIFAVTPRLGEVHDGWIRTPGGLGTVEPLWYRCMLEPEAVSKIAALRGCFGLGREPGPARSAAGDRIRLKIYAPDGAIWMSWLVSDKAEVLDRGTTVAYEQARLEFGLPEPERFDLGLLPRLLVNPLTGQ